MQVKNLLIRIDADTHKEIKRIALEKDTTIQEIFKKHNVKGFISGIIEAEKIEGK